jgi:hypothetical protein
MRMVHKATQWHKRMMDTETGCVLNHHPLCHQILVSYRPYTTAERSCTDPRGRHVKPPSSPVPACTCELDGLPCCSAGTRV